MRSSIVLAVAISAWTLGCGGDALNPGGTDDGACDASLGTSSDAPSGSSSEASSSSSPADAEAGSDALAAACPDAGLGAGALSTPHVPLTHRPSGSACPQTRGTQASTAGCTCAADGGACPCAACNTDSDCTKGPNGRCEASGPSTFKGCSYDQCFGDSDCMGGAPCECRASSASVVPNTCLGESNCAVDSDCGPGGYCSPSVVSNSCQCLAAPRSVSTAARLATRVRTSADRPPETAGRRFLVSAEATAATAISVTPLATRASTMAIAAIRRLATTT